MLLCLLRMTGFCHAEHFVDLLHSDKQVGLSIYGSPYWSKASLSQFYLLLEVPEFAHIMQPDFHILHQLQEKNHRLLESNQIVMKKLDWSRSNYIDLANGHAHTPSFYKEFQNEICPMVCSLGQCIPNVPGIWPSWAKLQVFNALTKTHGVQTAAAAPWAQLSMDGLVPRREIRPLALGRIPLVEVAGVWSVGVL